MINQELYIPRLVKIMAITKESNLVKTYRLEIDEDFKPGQFFQISVLGVGEVPISVSSSPTEKGVIELTVRNSGKVTGRIHDLDKGDRIGLRGPYGNSFPIEDMVNKNLIFVAGGIGLAPLRSVIRYISDNRKRYGHVYLLYGARTQDEMIFKDDLKEWKELKNFDSLLTVDKKDDRWKGNVGVVTTLFDKINLDSKDYKTFVCGPPVMIKYTIQRLVEEGLNDKDIIVSLERHMKCGVGKCGHCYLVNKYICVDGPVFSYHQLKDLKAVEPLSV